MQINWFGPVNLSKVFANIIDKRFVTLATLFIAVSVWTLLSGCAEEVPPKITTVSGQGDKDASPPPQPSK